MMKEAIQIGRPPAVFMCTKEIQYWSSKPQCPFGLALFACQCGHGALPAGFAYRARLSCCRRGGFLACCRLDYDDCEPSIARVSTCHLLLVY
jgi:hypothetical protein